MGKLWDHNSCSYIYTPCLVTSQYVDPEKNYSIGFRKYFKHGSPEADRYGFKTKLDLAMELMYECEELGVAVENYVFDSWYLSQELRHIDAYGKGWVSRPKPNSIVYHEKSKMSINEF